MANYSDIIRVLQRDLPTREAAYPLMDLACRSRLWLHPQPTGRVCLFFHGFTAGPYQFEPLGERLHRAGYNVLAPLLPGHGRAGTWDAQTPSPLPDDPKTYLQFALQWFNLARQMGDRVVVGGLSGGGTLAAWLAFEQAAAIDRALLFAPYLSASRRVVDLFVKTFDSYYAWDQTGSSGYPGFEFKALRAILTIGEYVMAKSRQGPSAPLFVISSESDKAVNNMDHQTLFERGLTYQPKCWYNRFGRVLDIPHTMMTAAEGNTYQDLLNSMAQAFIESDLTWAEVEEIAFRMTQGRTFPTVIQELGWANRASRDMPAMITMVDKWAIVVKRQQGNRRGAHGRRGRDR
ncbi:alpha/beta hydrolase [Leptolyngbya sp. PCC 6406]|uniref:alpha/beta hydrolase n=1 Tax=Leptolyngbya sp. PCC 6406 TaxID=1173264 RepID=UPI0002AC1C5A|nr:alpha/beta fold hydrolase [Leptolyngbya sp. PCC 6406]